MFRQEGGRSVIHCDRCPVRLDLGPTGIVQPRLRLPSGWIHHEPEHHLCPLCSRRELTAAIPADQPPPA